MPMNAMNSLTLADLTKRTGLDVLDHLDRDLAVPVTAGLQAQGDLIFVPLSTVADDVDVPWDAPWRAVPPTGVELLRGAAGGNAHTLVADPFTCRWTTTVRDRQGLALGVLRATATVYLLHPEHGASGVAAGTYVIRRQREATGATRTTPTASGRVGWSTVTLVAD
jgi:hypothetical protein